MLLDEVVEVVVVSTDEEERVGKGVEEDFFQGLKDAHADCGEQLKSEPTIKHGIA